MISTVIIPNITAMVLLIVLLFSSNIVSKHERFLDSKIFDLMIICNFIQCAGEMIAYLIDGNKGSAFHILGLIVNITLFVINILFAFLWVIYADYKIYEDIEHAKDSGKKLMLPAILVAFGSLVNLFTPIFFEITQDNNYQRTKWFFIPYLVTYFYLTYGTVFIYRKRNDSRRYVFLPAVVFMIPILLGSGVQFFFYGFSTVWIGVAIALVSVYVNVQNEMSYTDSLSGLYTRVYMYQYLENILKKKNIKIAGIMLDIDEFKSINDTYGHLIGDDAIRSAGMLIHKSLKNGSIAVRYGGDEFVILQQIQANDDVNVTLDKIVEEEEKFNRSMGKGYMINFSKGQSILDLETDTIDSFLERMDNEMYKSKKMKKQQKQEN